AWRYHRRAIRRGTHRPLVAGARAGARYSYAGWYLAAISHLGRYWTSRRHDLSHLGLPAHVDRAYFEFRPGTIGPLMGRRAGNANGPDTGRSARACSPLRAIRQAPRSHDAVRDDRGGAYLCAFGCQPSPELAERSALRRLYGSAGALGGARRHGAGHPPAPAARIDRGARGRDQDRHPAPPPRAPPPSSPPPPPTLPPPP